MTGSAVEPERFGVPPSAVVDARPAGAQDVIDEPDETDEAIAAEIASLTRDEPGLWLNPLNWLRGPAASAALLVLGATLVLLITSQIVGVLSSIQALDEPVRYGVYALIGLALVAILYGFGRLVVSFARFKASPRYSFRALQELAQRAALREEARTDLDAATAHLVRMLRDYPVDTDEQRTQLVRLGFKPGEADELADARRRLLNDFGDVSPSAWLERYRADFAGPVDEAARRIVRKRATLVGAKTAAVPHGGLDTAILLTHAYLMIADLCRLYRVRTNRAGTIALMWRIIVAAFVAGRLEDLTDEAANQITQHVLHATTGTLAKASSAVAGKVVGKAAEGAVNAMFAYRLGRAAIVRLRPLD